MFNRIYDGTKTGERYLVEHRTNKGCVRECASLCEAENFIQHLPEEMQEQVSIHIITGSGGVRPPYL